MPLSNSYSNLSGAAVADDDELIIWDNSIGGVKNILAAQMPLMPQFQTTFEKLSNKSTDTALGTSDTLYPTQKAVKTYVDAQGGGGVPADTVAALDGTGAAGDATTYSRGDHKHGDSYRHTHANQAALDNVSGTNSGDETVTTLGSKINAATEKTGPVDADMVGLMDSAAGNVLKKLSWTNVKATLKTYFDTLYTLANLGGVPTSRQVNGHALSADVTVTKTDVGLGNCDNTSDANKPVSSATQTALDGKQATLTNPAVLGSAQIWTATQTGPFAAQEVDGHADGTLSAAQVTNSVIDNVGQAQNLDATLNLPAAAAGYSFIMIVGTAVASQKWRIRAAANDKIYLDGVAGSDNGYVKVQGPALGNHLVVFSFKSGSGTYDWIAKSGNGVWAAE